MHKNALRFEWDAAKERLNISKHKVSFEEAEKAFDDPLRLLLKDTKHSGTELRLYCLGKVNGNVMTVRYTERRDKIRIIGAAYWREGRKLYDKKITKPKKVTYEANPWPEVNINDLEVIEDFLPKPWELAAMEKKIKVTITLNDSSIAFFKKQAKKYKTPYQAMIRNLLQQYAIKASDRL